MAPSGWTHPDQCPIRIIQVRTLRGILAADPALAPGGDAGEAAAGVLSCTLTAITDMAARLVRLRVPSPSDLARSCVEACRVDLSAEEVSRWLACLGQMGMTDDQMASTREAVSTHLSHLQEVYRKRSDINEKAREILRASGGDSAVLRRSKALVWDRLMDNVRQEQQVAVDGPRHLLLSILTPPQAARLIVEMHPGGVDMVKMGVALAALACGGDGGQSDPEEGYQARAASLA
ncbi:unnamed protein product [Ostreobium quekettii]|uniref:Uncharacterized protein n=1 Tax=Ostreobium quekettii TaxID=121088 RepID=A0A8S1IUP4_9CHLO|nr:unnamed protein product [Ostreobium quekettii]